MSWSDETCPVCRRRAKEALPRTGDYAEMICDDCGQYRINGSQLETIRGAGSEVRLNALVRAKERADRQGGMPTINYSDFS
jgi:CRISPR/Cas system-associated protein Cas10 (large subunit of type III CRISPR-Cas system)